MARPITPPVWAGRSLCQATSGQYAREMRTASSNQSSGRMLRSKRESCFTRKGILMLNETYVLWQALDRARLNLPREHPRVKPPGSSTGPCLRVRLDEQGHVAAVETVTKD